MKHVVFPDGARTSQVGYGCANLNGGVGGDESRKLIAAALDAGIRHFDVAPVYGSGLAENVLGAALEGISEPVTIATKIGIARPAASTTAGALRGVARRVLKMAPGLKRKLGQKVYARSRRPAFGIDEAETSFDDSLGRLRRDRVDVLLLHEPEVDDITDGLIRWLERQRETGRAGSVGIAARREKIATLLAKYPECRFVQTNWAADDPVIEVGDRFVSIHGAVRALGRIRTMIQEDAALRGRLSDQTDIDLADPGALAHALFDTALATNPDGLVLFATARIERIGELMSGPWRPLNL